MGREVSETPGGWTLDLNYFEFFVLPFLSNTTGESIQRRPGTFVEVEKLRESFY